MVIPATAKTPLIRFDAESSELEIIGRSIPEDAEELYQPVFQLLKRLTNKPSSSFKLVIQLEYFNTHSSRILIEVLRLLESMTKTGHLIKVFWVCEEDDEATTDFGDDLKQIVQVPIEMTVLNEEKYNDFLARSRFVTLK